MEQGSRTLLGYSGVEVSLPTFVTTSRAHTVIRVQQGGPKWIVGGTVFELWLGAL